MKKVRAVMTLNDSMDGAAFSVFIENFLCPQLWPGAVVVMDNLPAHKLTSIKSMIESLGARVICLSPYSPILILLKCGGRSLNLFCECSLPRPQR